MKFAYAVKLNETEILQECTYHTTELLENGMKRLTFPRGHFDGGMISLELVCDQDPANGVYCCSLRICNSGAKTVRITRADVGISFDTRTLSSTRTWMSGW